MLENWSEQRADKYYDMLLDICEDIANSPELGKNYYGIKSELFELRANRHIIFYRKSNIGLIEITRILHERMDFKSRIFE